MNRRRFLGLLALAAATAAIDPERLLWTPGATTHILPPQQGWPSPALAFHKDAFAFVMSPLAREGIEAAAKDFADEIDRRGLELFYPEYVARVDILCGFRTLRPELAVRING